MKIFTAFVDLSTSGKQDIIDITDLVRSNLKQSLMAEGNVTISIAGSTAGITTIEFEPGLVNDLHDAMDRLFPKTGQYSHNERWHDGNGFSHIRSAFLKTSVVIPFIKAELALGTWQQIIFCEFDNRPRERRIVTQFIGT